MTEKPFFSSLPKRGLVHIEGADRHDFLQNLITNNLDKLQPGRAIYACLLTPQGKFLHDFFVSAGEDFYLLECEGGERAQDLAKRLGMYRLRADVQISVEENVPVYAIIGAEHPPGYADPRKAEMGYRSFEKPDGMEEKPFEAWDTRRIRLVIPDGSRDLIPGQSTMDEACMDQFNAIDYKKGCYLGQELTARMHYRGLGKKHLYTVESDNLPAPGEPITANGKLIGEMRSKCGNVGLALLKDDKTNALESLKILT